MPIGALPPPFPASSLASAVRSCKTHQHAAIAQSGFWRKNTNIAKPHQAGDFWLRRRSFEISWALTGNERFHRYAELATHIMMRHGDSKLLRIWLRVRTPPG